MTLKELATKWRVEGWGQYRASGHTPQLLITPDEMDESLVAFVEFLKSCHGCGRCDRCLGKDQIASDCGLMRRITSVPHPEYPGVKLKQVEPTPKAVPEQEERISEGGNLTSMAYHAINREINHKAAPVVSTAAPEPPQIKVQRYDPIAEIQEIANNLAKSGDCIGSLKLEAAINVLAPESYKPAEGPEPLSYEQEIHSLLCAAASNTENLLEYFQIQAAKEKGEAKKLTHKCIAWKREQLRRIREIIPKALAAKNKPVATPVTVEAPGNNPWHLFHRLWTKAVGTDGYIKQEWRDLEAVMTRAKIGQNAATPKPIGDVVTSPTCPNCGGKLSYSHNRVLSFFSCNGRCKEVFELHSPEDMVKFFTPEGNPASTVPDGTLEFHIGVNKGELNQLISGELIDQCKPGQAYAKVIENLFETIKIKSALVVRVHGNQEG